MNQEEILTKVNKVFCTVFDDESLVIGRKTTAADIEDWDSLAHITLIEEIESAFDVHFDMKEVLAMQSVGDMVAAIEKKLGL